MSIQFYGTFHGLKITNWFDSNLIYLEACVRRRFSLFSLDY